MIKKNILELSSIIYWFGHGVNSIYVSKKPGYYPPDLIERAKALSVLQPYPWRDIIFAWVLIGIATAVLYFVVKKSSYNFLVVLAYSLSLLILYGFLVPTDVGGVYYAFTDFIISTFIIVILGFLLKPVINKYFHA